ncbi:hypothetical protein WA026_013903 [Henosepilachna vigintioctopunctata]|uniref:lysozyme n=1 Tax=Henosepilachna vigintioctopunctata TaxID=420089 RepID=A0AAW1U927_9CUCU
MNTWSFLFFLIIWQNADAKIYDKCEFVKKLQSLGVPRDQLGTWTCIANFESHFDTTAINHQTDDYGILQISSIYWCSKTDTPGGDCHITCKQLLNDDITDDVTCARHVFDVTQKQSGNGFTAWTTYNEHCNKDNSEWTKNCL